MSTLIKNAIVYAAVLPEQGNLEQHLSERLYTPIGASELSRISFVPHALSGELVTSFEGGFAFCMRVDEKILPKAIVRASAVARIARIEQSSGKRLSKVERLAIHDDQLAQLAKTALVKTAIITAYYRTDKGYLIVPASKGMANHLVGTLIHVVGSVKTTTIHISEIKNGLTTRLKNHLAEDVEAFAAQEFSLGEQVELLRGKSEQVNYKLSSLDSAKLNIIERIENGFQVRALSLVYGGVEFKLNQDFTFKQIGFLDDVDSSPEDDAVYTWKLEASIQSMLFGNVVTSLCDLLGYKPPQDEAADINSELTTA